ncbi:MAG: SDR family oxidoreductase [Candidatus Alcyoniella australis]|nr:SDR family oxidoreductase [Candidatus Alcyoniella australis]
MANKVLVTGGTGLLGGNLIRLLVERGYSVKALVRSTSNTKGFDDLDVERVQGDIMDPQSLAQAAEGCQGVFHSAAMVTMWAPDFEKMRRINVDGTRNVLEAAKAAGVKRAVHVSTVDAIGFSTPDGWGTRNKPSNESVPFQNERFGVPYMTTKHMAQQLALSYNSDDFEVVVGNPTYMIGPYDVKPSSSRMVLEVKSGTAKVYTGGGNNFVDVRDVAAGLIAAFERGKPGELYIMGHRNLSYREIFTLIAGVVGVKPPSFALPKPIALIGGAAGSLYGHLLGKEPEINLTTAKLGYVEHYFDSSKAIAELELPQTPIETAVGDAYQWFQANGYVK